MIYTFTGFDLFLIWAFCIQKERNAHARTHTNTRSAAIQPQCLQWWPDDRLLHAEWIINMSHNWGPEPTSSDYTHKSDTSTEKTAVKQLQ